MPATAFRPHLRIRQVTRRGDRRTASLQITLSLALGRKPHCLPIPIETLRMASPSASPTPAPDAPPVENGVDAWRVILRIAGALFALAIFAYWAAAGMNTGWTKDKIALKKTDEVTGSEYIEYQDHFLPGLEFLTLGTGFGLAVIGVTFLVRKKP